MLRDIEYRDLVKTDEISLIDLVVIRKAAALVAGERLLCLLDDAGGQLFVGLLRAQLVRVPHGFDKQAREQVNWLGCQAAYGLHSESHLNFGPNDLPFRK